MEWLKKGIGLDEYEVKRSEDGKTGLVTGYAAIFNSRDDGRMHDMFLPGAFRKSLAEDGKDVVYLPSHDYGIHISQIPAVPMVVKEDRNGLYTETKFFLNTQAGADSFTVLDEYQKAGRPMGLSITWKPLVWEMKAEGRNVSEAMIKEYGHTAIPMHPDARTTSTKSAELEEFFSSAYYTARDVKYLEEQGMAMTVKGLYGEDSCIAVVTPDDLHGAVYAYQMGRYGDSPDLKSFIVKRAGAIGMNDELPKSWGSSKKSLFDELTSLLTGPEDEVLPRLSELLGRPATAAGVDEIKAALDRLTADEEVAIDVSVFQLMRQRLDMAV